MQALLKILYGMVMHEAQRSRFAHSSHWSARTCILYMLHRIQADRSWPCGMETCCVVSLHKRSVIHTNSPILLWSWWHTICCFVQWWENVFLNTVNNLQKLSNLGFLWKGKVKWILTKLALDGYVGVTPMVLLSSGNWNQWLVCQACNYIWRAAPCSSLWDVTIPSALL